VRFLWIRLSVRLQMLPRRIALRTLAYDRGYPIPRHCLQSCSVLARYRMLKEESNIVAKELTLDKIKYYQIYPTQPPEPEPITFFVVFSWLLAMTFGMTFWTLLFRITLTIARLVDR
jgi:hypothetical protein